MPILKNQRHEAFAQAIAMKANATDAYMSAGFKSDRDTARANGYKLLTNAHIVGRIEELTKKAAQRVELDKAWVLTRLMKNARMCLGEDEVKIKVFDEEEGDVVEKTVTKIDAAGANRALELLGKELRMFIERKEVGDPGDFDKLDDKELARALKDALVELSTETQH